MVEQLFYVIVTILKVFEKKEIIVIFFYGILSLLFKILNYTCYTSFQSRHFCFWIIFGIYLVVDVIFCLVALLYLFCWPVKVQKHAPKDGKSLNEIKNNEWKWIMVIVNWCTEANKLLLKHKINCYHYEPLYFF